MSILNTLPDTDDVIITIHAAPADTPARPAINGVPMLIPNNKPTTVPVPYARVVAESGYSFSLEAFANDEPEPQLEPNPEPEADEGNGERDKLVTDEQIEFTNAPPVLGGDGAGGGAQPQGDDAAAPTPLPDADAAEAPAFDPTPVIDGNAATTIARIADLSPEQLVATREAEVAGKNRASVLKAIDARTA